MLYHNSKVRGFSYSIKNINNKSDIDNVYEIYQVFDCNDTQECVLSLIASWCIIQFSVSPSSVKIRHKYGKNGWNDWKEI